MTPEPNLSRDKAFKEAASLAAKGWRLVLLHGVDEQGRCTCGKQACVTPGKHPSGGNDWPSRATSDENVIEQWFERNGVFNVGVLLGEGSGIVDVEFDNAEGEAAVKKYGLDAIDTPAYSSGRGVHRLFRWESWMPAAAVVKVEGVEVRIGGGNRAAQSVSPPSRHHSGRQYAWLPGRSPDEVEPAPLPPAFRDAVLKQAGTQKGTGCVRRARDAVARREITTEGGRHDRLVGTASDLCFKEQNLNEAAESGILNLVRAVNSTYCSPPKPDDEVCRIVADQVRFYRCRREAGDFTTRSTDPDAIAGTVEYPLERYGLEVRHDGRVKEYRPGKWSLTIYDSSPAEYVLYVFQPRTGDTVPVSLSATEMLSPANVASRILDVTKDVDVTDPNPGEWRNAWLGHTAKLPGGGKVAVRGLKSCLIEEATHEAALPENNRQALVAGALLNYLGRYERTDDPTVKEPSTSGAPRWIIHQGRSELWFDLSTAWTRAAEAAGIDISEAERRSVHTAVRRHVGEDKFSCTNRRNQQGNSQRYYRWDNRHIAALERLTGRDEGVPTR
jgi:hypothetical protein